MRRHPPNWFSFVDTADLIKRCGTGQSKIFFSTLILWALAVAATASASPPISLKTISAGQLVSPVGISNAGDGSNRLFVCDQVGQIRIIQDEMLLPTPFLDLSAKLVPLTSSYDEAGLLSVAFHPGFSNAASPGYRKFYVFYSAVSPNVVGDSFISAMFHRQIPARSRPQLLMRLTTGQAVPAISGVTGGAFSPTINATYTVTVTGANFVYGSGELLEQ